MALGLGLPVPMPTPCEKESQADSHEQEAIRNKTVFFMDISFSCSVIAVIFIFVPPARQILFFHCLNHLLLFLDGFTRARQIPNSADHKTRIGFGLSTAAECIARSRQPPAPLLGNNQSERSVPFPPRLFFMAIIFPRPSFNF